MNKTDFDVFTIRNMFADRDDEIKRLKSLVAELKAENVQLKKEKQNEQNKIFRRAVKPATSNH
jgi:DNA-directed RNA polymerase alpha subunit